MRDDWWDVEPEKTEEEWTPSRRRRRRFGKRDPKDEADTSPKPKYRKSAPKKGPVPHFKRQCIRCHGTGRAPCQVCGGSGQVLSGLDLNGAPRFGNCAGCLGTKLLRCPSCGGEGIS